MRNIMQSYVRHKRAATLAAILPALAALTIGCGGSGDTGDDTRPAADTAAVEVSYTVQRVALDAWMNLMEHVRAGDRVRDDEYARLFDLPAYAMTYGEGGGPDLNPVILRNLAEYSFSPGEKTGRLPKKKQLLHNFEYLSMRWSGIDSMAREIEDSGLVGRALGRAWEFVPAFRVPESVTIHLSASAPMQTWYPPSHLVIDLGLALAAGDTLLENMIAAALVRSLSPMEGPLPQETEGGRDALKATLARLHYEGIVNWIEDYPSLRLDPQHYIYRNPDPNRTRPIRIAVDKMERMETMMSTLLDPDSDQLAMGGGAVDDLLRLNRSYQPMGWAMSTLIVDHVGRDRFVTIANESPEAWLRAYQEAAIAGGSTENLALMTPFDEILFSRMMDLLDD